MSIERREKSESQCLQWSVQKPGPKLPTECVALIFMKITYGWDTVKCGQCENNFDILIDLFYIFGLYGVWVHHTYIT